MIGAGADGRAKCYGGTASAAAEALLTDEGLDNNAQLKSWSGLRHCVRKIADLLRLAEEDPRAARIRAFAESSVWSKPIFESSKDHAHTLKEWRKH